MNHVPTMGQIIKNPKKFVYYINECGWLHHKHKEGFYLFNGKNNCPEIKLNDYFCDYLCYKEVFTLDSANYFFGDQYYIFNKEKFINKYKIDGKEILNIINYALSNIPEEIKFLYIKEDRIKKLDRILK